MKKKSENLLEVVSKELLGHKQYVSKDGKLLKGKVYMDINNMDSSLINILINNDRIKKAFFVKVKNSYVFDKQAFLWFIDSKEFLPSSYTKYGNTIGLTCDGDFIRDKGSVILDYPYKDCVLVGGQTKEDQKRDEIFLNQVISDNEITNLLEPKVFTNTQKCTKDGVNKMISFNDKDNLVIKGNNLITISSLLKRYEGRIKLIYIDPPYNTGSDSFSYNDSFNRSTWLLFMKNRLEIAKRLLSNDGAIYVQLDYHQVHYAKVMMDEIFGENNFQREIIWRIGWVSGYKTKDNNWIRNHDTILFYSKDSEIMKKSFNKENIPNKDFKELIDKDLLNKKFKELKISKDNSYELYNYINYKSRIDKYPIEDVWNGNEYDDLNSIAIVSFSGETVSRMLNPDDEVKGQKSEKLIERIIKAHTKPGDIVMDFFGGTGTTAAVAHKMNRQYIIIEQLDKHIDIMKRRLIKVIEGDQSGISKIYKWKGGGSFVYCELKENSQELIKEIKKSTVKTINKTKEKIYNDYRIVPYISKKELEQTDKLFEELSINEKKQALIDIVDKNKLYINYSDIDDKNYNISKDEKSFTKSFYEGV